MRPNRPVYLDNQATTPCDPRVVAVMLPFFTERFGNPHSAEHVMGQDAESAVEIARAQVAALIDAEPREIVFTSGATESNNLAIKGAARYAASQGSERRRVITVATEHSCVLASVADLAQEGFDPVVLPVQRDGLLDSAVLAAALAGAPTLLVSIMAANNETGVRHDLPRPWPPPPTRPGRCSTPMRRRRWARRRSAWRGSIWPRSAATRSMGRRASARCMSAAARGPVYRRSSPAAARSGVALGHPVAGAAGGVRRGLPPSRAGNAGGIRAPSCPTRPAAGRAAACLAGRAGQWLDAASPAGEPQRRPAACLRIGR